MIEKKIRKFPLSQQPENDILFWKSKSELERLHALEQLRIQFINLFFNGNRPRFQRVYTAFKQA